MQGIPFNNLQSELTQLDKSPFYLVNKFFPNLPLKSSNLLRRVRVFNKPEQRKQTKNIKYFSGHLMSGGLFNDWLNSSPE